MKGKHDELRQAHRPPRSIGSGPGRRDGGDDHTGRRVRAAVGFGIGAFVLGRSLLDGHSLDDDHVIDADRK